MTVGELIEKLRKHSADAEVCVEVTKCMAPSVAEPVTGVCRGFDWTTGKVILYTEDNLIREHETCKRCGMYGVKAAHDISSRYNWLNMNTGDMEIAVYLGKKKMFSVPFNVRKQQEGEAEMEASNAKVMHEHAMHQCMDTESKKKLLSIVESLEIAASNLDDEDAYDHYPACDAQSDFRRYAQEIADVVGKYDTDVGCDVEAIHNTIKEMRRYAAYVTDENAHKLYSPQEMANVVAMYAQQLAHVSGLSVGNRGIPELREPQQPR